MNALGLICQGYGTAEVTYCREDDPYVWSARLVSLHDGTATVNHVHGERLEATIEALWEQLQDHGVVTIHEVERNGAL